MKNARRYLLERRQRKLHLFEEETTSDEDGGIDVSKRSVEELSKLSVVDLVRGIRSGSIALSPDEMRKLLPMQTMGSHGAEPDRVITALAKTAQKKNIKEWWFYDRYLLSQTDFDTLTVAHILALNTAKTGWFSNDREVLKLVARGSPSSDHWDYLRGVGAVFPETAEKVQEGDTVAHYLYRFSTNWYDPFFILKPNSKGETGLAIILNRLGFSEEYYTQLRRSINRGVKEKDAEVIYSSENLKKMNVYSGFKRYIEDMEITILDDVTGKPQKMKVEDFLEKKGIEGREVPTFAMAGALGQAIKEQRVDDIAKAFLRGELQDLSPDEEVTVFQTSNKVTSVAVEVAKGVNTDETKVAVEYGTWASLPDILKMTDPNGLTVAHILAISSSITGWGEAVDFEILALPTDYILTYQLPSTEEKAEGEEVSSEKGDTVAHFLARFNPEWETEDQKILELSNTVGTTVEYILALRSGEATPLKQLTKNDLNEFKKRFKVLQYDPDELIRSFKWLYLAEFEDAEIEINRKGNLIIWKNGVWKDGEWLIGTWLNGTWLDGVWKSGNWKNGTWKDGVWQDGEWDGGTWENGKWLDGTWNNGTWLDGVFQEGVWKNGEWKGGRWIHGVWLEGSYRGAKRQAGVWAGEVWEKDAADYSRLKERKGILMIEAIANRFISVDLGAGVIKPHKEQEAGAKFIEALKQLVAWFPWLRTANTEYDNAVVRVLKIGRSRALLWEKGNWYEGKWGADGIWGLSCKGKFTGKDAKGHTRKVPPLPQYEKIWTDPSPLTIKWATDNAANWKQLRGFDSQGRYQSTSKVTGKTSEINKVKEEPSKASVTTKVSQAKAAAGKKSEPAVAKGKAIKMNDFASGLPAK